VRRTSFLTLFCLVAGLGVATAAPAAAVTDVVVTLPMATFTDILVDEPHGRVFLTGGGSTGIVVRNLDGGAVTTITNQPGAAEMALSPDGTTLYVALELGDAISAIDPVTLTEKARYATGASTCPESVAAIGTGLWFGYGCSSGNIGYVDLSGQTPVVTLAKSPAGSYFSAPPRLATSPADPTRMVAGHWGYSPSYIRTLTINGTTLTEAAKREVGGNLQDFALSDDGTQVVVASGAPYYHPRYKVADLSADGVFGTNNPYPNAVAVAGNYVAAGIDASYDDDIRIYQSDGVLVREYETGDHELKRHGLAFTPDGSRLFAVSGDYWTGTQRLHVLYDPTKATSTLTLTAPSASINASFTVTGTLTSAGLGPEQTIHVSRTSKHGTVSLPDVTTGLNGSFGITDLVTKRGAYTYTATFDGDASHGAATKSVVVNVAGKTPSLTIATNASTYSYRGTAVVTATLGTTDTNRTVTLTATPYNMGTATLKTGVVDAGGKISASYVVGRRTTFTAYFAGDDVYEPRTVSRTVTVKVSLSQRMSGHYGISGSYRLYRTSVDPVLTAAVTPNRSGACMAFLVQRYSSGAWRTVASHGCLTLEYDSRVAAVFTGTPMTGYPYRIRSSYAGETYNAQTIGAWQYFKFR
jgi:hypothetical protein